MAREPAVARQPVVNLVRALVPASEVQVPATRESDKLARVLPIPSIVAAPARKNHCRKFGRCGWRRRDRGHRAEVDRPRRDLVQKLGPNAGKGLHSILHFGSMRRKFATPPALNWSVFATQISSSRRFESFTSFPRASSVSLPHDRSRRVRSVDSSPIASRSASNGLEPLPEISKLFSFVSLCK